MLTYTIAWISYCTVASALALVYRRDVALLTREYWSFLLQPWKLVTFVPALIGIVVIAPYTGDPTWDGPVAAMMAIATFLTAPWSVGILTRLTLRRARLATIRVALVSLLFASAVWMLSASWCYDLYNWWRLGFYPPTWKSNIGASSFLYVAAGCFWNLDWRPNRGISFAFLEPEWLASVDPQSGFRRFAWLAGLIMLVVAALFAMFPLLHFL